jgi:hypothetical protein
MRFRCMRQGARGAKCRAPPAPRPLTLPPAPGPGLWFICKALNSNLNFKAVYTRGRQKKKNRGPPWWVGGSEYEKGLG